jgi:hypothetical protein
MMPLYKAISAGEHRRKYFVSHPRAAKLRAFTVAVDKAVAVLPAACSALQAAIETASHAMHLSPPCPCRDGLDPMAGEVEQAMEMAEHCLERACWR